MQCFAKVCQVGATACQIGTILAWWKLVNELSVCTHPHDWGTWSDRFRVEGLLTLITCALTIFWPVHIVRVTYLHLNAKVNTLSSCAIIVYQYPSLMYLYLHCAVGALLATRKLLYSVALLEHVCHLVGLLYSIARLDHICQYTSLLYMMVQLGPTRHFSVSM